MRVRHALTLAAALAILVIGGTPAMAAGPVRVPSPSAPGDLEGICDFVVHAEFPVNDQYAIATTDADGNPTRVLVTGALVAELTNMDTGGSITLNISGPADITFGDDGSTTLVATGSWALFFFADQLGPGSDAMFVHTRGRTVIRTESDGFHQTILSQTGTQRDLCEVLATA